MTIDELKEKAAEIRETVLDIVYRAKAGHIGGDLSAADIMTALFFSVLRADPKHPEDPERDRFVLSKGHAAEVYYACLAKRGYFPESELAEYGRPGSRLIGHPTNKVPGIEINTGALGHGLSIATGMALGMRMQGRRGRVFVLCGDGEQAEGSNWEALMAASSYGLDNLTAILDRNHLQISGNTEDVMKLEPLADKYRAFGWNTVEIDGNDMEAVVRALTMEHEGSPLMIIAHTVKGKGISEMENIASWHHGVPDEDLYMRARAELASQRRKDG